MKLFNVMQTTYANFDNSVRNYLSKMFGQIGMEYTHTQIFGVIFDGIKGVMQNVMFYIEDAFTEQNVFTAARKKSILSLAKISGYEGYYGSAATGSVVANVVINNGTESENKTNKIYIRNGSRLINNNTGVTYIIDLPINNYIVDISKAYVLHTFKIIEGFRLVTQFTANGFNLETFLVECGTSLFDTNYVLVYVNGELYNQVANMYEMKYDEKAYVLSVGFDSTFQVMFGDGTHGRKLVEGQTIQVYYVTHHGTIGNISDNSTADFTFYDNGTDSNGDSVDINNFMRISISDNITGGTNADSILFVKGMIGYNTRSSILANENNYQLFLKRFSFVGYSNIWSEPNSMVVCANIIQNQQNKIKTHEDYLKLDDNDFILTDNQKQIIRNVIDKSERTFAGVSLKFIDPIIRKYAVHCYIKCDNKYAREAIKENIQDIIIEYFMNIPSNTLFISKTDIIARVIDLIEGIQYFDIQFISKLNEDTFKSGYYIRKKLEYVNATYDYIEEKVMYETNGHYGLDEFGNILLESNLEIPILGGDFRYYADKNDKNSDITISGINCLFI